MADIAFGSGDAPGLPAVNLPALDGARRPLQITISKPSPAAPTFDPSAPFTVEGAGPVAATPPAFDPSKPFDVEPQGPQISASGAGIAGLEQGLTAGFGDELTGAKEAGLAGLPSEVTSNLRLSPLGNLIAAAGGGAKIAIEKLLGGDEAQKAYQAGRDRVRALNKSAQEQHPYAYTGGEVAGALATIPAMPGVGVAKGAGFIPRAVNAATTGGLYGATLGAGEGEGAEDTARRALAGAEQGFIGGGIAAPVAEAGGKGFALLARPFKAGLNPDAEAARRVAGAFEKDRPGTTLKDVANALEMAGQAGEPLVVADLGKETVRGVARSAANTSTEARNALQENTSRRFLDQGQRVADDVRFVVGGNPEASGLHEAIRDAARASNKPMYARAYAAGDRPIWSPELEQLAGSDAVVSAIRSAVTKGKDNAINEGFGAFNPGVRVTDDGRLMFNKGPKGIPTYPNIQFWDYVQRELSNAEGAAGRAGRSAEARTIGGLRRKLNAELDKQEPLFGQARSGAARFFKADDALTAGEEFLSSKMANAEARSALAKMTPAERTAFAYGFASKLLESISKVPLKERSTVATKMFLNSPQAKERILLALGPDGARRLESRIRLESMMELTRNAVAGNSSTARQLIEAGLAGGVGYGWASGDWSLQNLETAALTGALLKAGARQIDARVARRVGELLASNDPEQIRKVAELVSKSPRVMDGVRRTDALVSRVLGLSAPSAPRLLPAPVASRADEQKQGGN
ncbi:MAG TPA: hypothetical protein VFB29_00435 [Pseudolabrys sp.]|nr:hypothetical protein [Pseudolabrys sp.]